MNEENISELHTIWDEARSYIEYGNRDKAIEIYKYILLILFCIQVYTINPKPIGQTHNSIFISRCLG